MTAQDQINAAILKRSLAMCEMVDRMTKEEKKHTAELIKMANIASILTKTSINHQLKSFAKDQRGKVKRVLNAMGSNPYSQHGVDKMFENKWNKEISVSDSV